MGSKCLTAQPTEVNQAGGDCRGQYTRIHLNSGLTRSGTASTVKVPVKAPREAVVYSRPMA